MTFNWYAEPRMHKNVKLSKVYMWRGITCNDIIWTLRGIGVYEWQRHMSYVLSQSVLKAFEQNQNVADITKMFSCDLVAYNEFGKQIIEQKDVCEFLMERLFKTVRETPEEIIVCLKNDAIKH